MCISHLTSTESPGIICSLPSSLALLLLEVNVRKREGRQFAAARPAGERAGAGARLGCAVFRRVNLAPPARVQALLLETQDEVAQAGQVVREAVGGLPTVRSFGAEEHEACRYEEALERCRKLRWRGNLERALYLLFRRVRRGVAGAGKARETPGWVPLGGAGRGLGEGRSLSQPRPPPRCCTW